MFGDRHGRSRATAPWEREPSVRRLGLKLTESTLLFWCPAGLPRDASWWGIVRQTEREKGRQGEKERSENDVVERETRAKEGCGALTNVSPPTGPLGAHGSDHYLFSGSSLPCARDATWGKGTGRAWRALLYLRGVIEAIQQYWFRAAERSTISKNAPATNPSMLATFIRYRRARTAPLFFSLVRSWLRDFFSFDFARLSPLMPAECDRIAARARARARFPPRELRGDHGPSVAAVASVVPLLEKLRWVRCFINSTSDLDRGRAGLGTAKDNTLISLWFSHYS